MCFTVKVSLPSIPCNVFVVMRSWPQIILSKDYTIVLLYQGIIFMPGEANFAYNVSSVARSCELLNILWLVYDILSTLKFMRRLDLSN